MSLELAEQHTRELLDMLEEIRQGEERYRKEGVKPKPAVRSALLSGCGKQLTRIRVALSAARRQAR